MNKIIKIFVVLMFTVIGGLPVIHAQVHMRGSGSSVFNCFSFGINGGIDQYRGDYHAFKSALRDLDYKLGYGFSLEYTFNNEYVSNTLNNIFDKRLSLFFGVKKMTASSNKIDEGNVMSMDILEFSGMFRVNILKYSSVKTLDDGGMPFSPYVEAGMGYTGFKCENVNDYNHGMTGGYADNDFSFLPVVIIGWGVKYNLARGVTVGLDGSYRFVFTDDIDHLTDRSERNDQYYYIGAELMFNLGEIFSR